MKKILTEEEKEIIGPWVNALRYFRLEKDVLEEDLALMVDIHPDTLNRYLNLDGNLNSIALAKIIKVLGLDIYDIALHASSYDLDVMSEKLEDEKDRRANIKDEDFDLPSRLRATKRNKQNESK